MTARRRRRPRRPAGWTTKAGLGWDHQRAVAELKKALRSGVDRCPRCGHLMYAWQRLDGGHTRARALGNTGPPDRLEHARCNQLAGARLGGAIAAARAKARAAGQAPPPSRRAEVIPPPKGRARW